MSSRTLVYTTLLLVPMFQAAVVTLYTPAVAGPTLASYLPPPIFETNSIVSVSAVDVLPGNITEYAVGKAYSETIFDGTGSNGLPANLRTTFWTSTSAPIIELKAEYTLTWFAQIPFRKELASLETPLAWTWSSRRRLSSP